MLTKDNYTLEHINELRKNKNTIVPLGQGNQYFFIVS